MTANPSKRTLKVTENRQKYIIFGENQYINLSSNDYLSLSDISLQQQFLEECNFKEHFILSNPSSRLMTGNSIHYKYLEESIAQLFDKESALVLNCGFMVNLSLLSTITEKSDLIIADKLVHASVIDGLKMADCDFVRFRHNDTAHLRSILEQKRAKYNNVYLVTESIFSMDGDIAPLRELVSLKEEFDLKIYLDEAHAFGVYGKKGCGIAEQEGLLSKIDIIVVTLGKALASQGGVVICSKDVREILINKMRTLIFSTAIPDISLMWSKFLVDRLPLFESKRDHLAKISLQLRDIITNTPSSSHIIPLIVGSNQKAVDLQNHLAGKGFWTTAIRHPTVAKGSERVRISLNSALTEGDIADFINKIGGLKL